MSQEPIAKLRANLKGAEAILASARRTRSDAKTIAEAEARIALLKQHIEAWKAENA